jgi:hypothetical protein
MRVVREVEQLTQVELEKEISTWASAWMARQSSAGTTRLRL